MTRFVPASGGSLVLALDHLVGLDDHGGDVLAGLDAPQVRPHLISVVLAHMPEPQHAAQRLGPRQPGIEAPAAVAAAVAACGRLMG